MRASRVLILYNEPVLSSDHPDIESELEVVSTVAAVNSYLTAAGFDVNRLGADRDPEHLLAGLRAHQPDVVFNLFEGTGDDGNTEAYVAGLLDWLELPFTGSPFQTLALAKNKQVAKCLLRGAGLPTPAGFVVDRLPIPASPLDWPVIIKPANQDASVGLDQGSVVTDQCCLENRVTALLKGYGAPVLVEEFIDGRELNVALVEVGELRTLPISEILFTNNDAGYWPIVTYDAKWKPGSRDFEATPPCYPAKVAPRLAQRLDRLARRAFRLLGCRDYARVDFRLRPSGKPYILEVNPNPDFHPTAGLACGLSSAGISHGQFAADLVRTALARGQRQRDHGLPLAEVT